MKTRIEKRIKKLEARIEMLEGMTAGYEVVSMHAIAYGQLLELYAMLEGAK